MTRQKLGQHFLINKSAIQKIIAALDLKENDTVIEIGPGRGALTLPLMQACSKIGDRNDRCKITAVEKDVVLANELKKLLRIDPRSSILELIIGDALKVIPQIISSIKHRSSNYKLVGNIPYYITGKLLRILGELENKPSMTVLTIQKEVAERLAAKPPKMNLLAAAIQIWARPEIIGRLSPEDFNPPPEVDSAIIKLVPNPKSLDFKRYFSLIKVVFKQPRKTVLNNLSTGVGMNKGEVLKILKNAGLEGTERPQNLDLETLIKLSTLF